METRSSLRLGIHVILGLLVILAGILLTLDNLNILDARAYLHYWPVLIIIYGLWRVMICATAPGKVWGLFWVFVGSLLMLDMLDILYVHFLDLWPLILVAIGTNLLLGSARGRRHLASSAGEKQGNGDDIISILACLGGFKRVNSSQNFRGGDITAIMGGAEIDLRQASIQEGNAALDVFAFWGGIEIRVPADWVIVNEGTPLLGGFEDETRLSKGESSKKLIIRGYAIMGGVEVKN